MSAAERLASLLEDLAAVGVFPPCTRDPDRWFDGGPIKLARAALECVGCPVRALCAATGEEGDERFGVWGGVVRDPAAHDARVSA